MKKLNLILLSAFTLMLSGVLMACSFKKVEANFTQTEEAVSAGASILLDEFLQVSGVDKKDVEYQISNPSLFSITDRVATAADNAYGKTNVMAVYNKSSLASMQLVVKKPFDAPTNVHTDNNSLVWNAVVEYFDGETTPTAAEEYIVSGTFLPYENNEPAQENKMEDIVQKVQGTTFTPSREGVYNLKVQAAEKGYFDLGAQSEEVTLYYGFMDAATNVAFANGTLSWGAVEGAQYQVKFDGTLLGALQTQTSFNLTEMLDRAESGRHTASVLAYDASGKKLAKESAEVSIIKLQDPVITYNFQAQLGGRLQISPITYAQSYNLVLKKGEEQKTFTFNSLINGVLTDLPELGAGLWDATMYVDATSSGGNTFYYHSNEISVGKIYKLEKISTFEGRGDNAANANAFNVSVGVQEDCQVQTQFAISGSGSELLPGFDAQTRTKEFQITASGTGQQHFAITQMPQMANNSVQGQDVFVINSDISAEQTFEKLAAFEGGISHGYAGEVSELTFSPVEGVTSYTLRHLNADSWEEVSTTTQSAENGKLKFVLDGKIEEKYQAQEGKHTFEIEAHAENSLTSISSTILQELSELATPTAEAEDIDGWTYKWRAEEGANYRLEIYTFEEYREEYARPEFLPDGSAEKQEVTETLPEHTFEEEGFYFVKVFAVATQPTQVSSKGSLNKFFYLSRQLESGSVYFGWNEELKPDYETEGYFVKIEGDDEDTVRYEITVTSGLSQAQPQKFAKRSDGIYAIEDAFESGLYTIKVVGYGKDDKVHTPTEEKTITVQRLAAVTHEDLIFDDQTNSITLNGKAGVRDIDAKSNAESIVPQKKDGGVFVDIKGQNSFNLQFTLLGNAIVQNNLFSAGQVIYLDSAPAKFNFIRLNAPESLEYNDGNLNFTHTDVVSTKNYFVDMACMAGGVQYTLSVEVSKTENNATVRTSVAGANATQEVVEGSFYEAEINNITIKIADILKLLENAQLKNILDVTKSVEFSVWAYCNNVTVADEGTSNVSLSSLGCKSETVGKIAPVNISFESTADTYTLNWQKPEGVTDDQTKYVVYRTWTDASGKTTTEVIPSEEFEESGYSAQGVTFSNKNYSPSIAYTFYVEVTNPHYLSSASSNRINVYRLSPIESVQLTDEAKLTLTIKTADDNASYNKGIKVNFAEDEGSTSDSTVEDGTVELGEKGGTYKFYVIGAGFNESDATYYLDSAEVSYKAITMSKLAEGSEKKVTYASNLIKWDEFGSAEEKIGGLEYVVFFQGVSEKAYHTYKTTATQINLNDIKDLRDIISNISAGDVKVQVAAHIAAHKIEGDKIYYEIGSKALISGETENNYYVYEGADTIKKLSIPEIKELKFAYDGEANLQHPNIEISVAGNYGASAVFQVVLNDNLLPKQTVANLEEAYKLTLEYQSFANLIGTAQTLSIEIYVLCEGEENEAALPSQEKVISVMRASKLTGVEFERNIVNPAGEEPEENRGFSGNLKLSFNSQTARPKEFAGGIVLAITYKKNNVDAEQTEYIVANNTDSADGVIEYSLKSFIEEKLEDGGTISVSAYANNFSEQGTYVLACPDAAKSDTYVVLSQVKTGTDITKTESGFTISNTLNNDNTIYIVEYGAHTYQVAGKNTAEGTVFEFVVPEDGIWNEDKTYDLNIYAVQPYEDGTKYIMSKANAYTYSLSRLPQVGTVSLERKRDDNSLQLSFGKVEGAKEYLFKVYRQDKEVAQPFESRVTNVEAGDVKVALSSLFGRDYILLVNSGIVTEDELKTDIPLRIEIIAVPSGEQNYSLSKQINAVIYGNTIDEKTDFSVSKGLLYLTTKSENSYRYRFVADLNEEQISDWKTFTSTNGIMNLLDTTTEDFGTEFRENCTNGYFALEAQILAGETTSDEHIFGFDSIVFRTKDTDLSFFKTNELEDVTYSDENKENIKFIFSSNMIEQDEVTILVGLNENSLTKGEANPITLSGGRIDGDNKVFEYSFLGITAALGREVAGQLYFWAWQQGEDQNVLNVASQSYSEFSFNVITDFKVDSIVKLGTNTHSSTVTQDYINTYATFVNDDAEGTKQTLGINVRVVQHTDESDFDIVKFIDKEKLQSIDLFTADKVSKNVFAINLLEIFDSAELASLSGKAEVSFSKIAIINNVYSISNWVSTWDKAEGEAQPLTFTRLAKLRNINLKGGDIVWSRGGNDVDTYYVYLYSITADGEASTYSIHDTESDTPRCEATKFATSGSYYVAVQSINKDDPFVLSSVQAYKTTNINGDGTGDKLAIHRNQVLSPLTLKNGNLQVDWQSGEGDDNFVSLLTPEADFNVPNLANKLINQVFTSPFTFTVSDLISTRETEQVRFCLRFESIGEPKVIKTYYVNALYLLASLAEYGKSNDVTPLDTLGSLASIGGTGAAIITDLKNKLENARFGIGNQQSFFDTMFETLQSGKYSLTYCLMGNYHTLNSVWYDFSANDVNEIVVNEEPDVQIIKTPNSTAETNILNSYKAVIKKSNIVGQAGATQAKEYFVHVGAQNYRITSNQWKEKAGNADYVLTTFGENPEKFVSVYECSEDGAVQQGGTHLMFYFTLNTQNGNLANCFLGVFGQDFAAETSSEEPFEVCAQGNNYSCSSKSEYWRVTFLGFTNFRVIDGVFEWETQLNLDTTVVWKKDVNSSEQILPSGVDGSRRLATFSLDDENIFGEGLYTYFKFIILGEVQAKNVALIDSEIIQVDNVYKLFAPKLSNNLGQLGISIGEGNDKILQDTYSKNNPYTYILGNNNTTDTWRKTDERSGDKQAEYLYELGTTWVDAGTDEAAFKNHEILAGEFTVQLIGSTADFKAEQGEQYNIKSMKCEDSGEVSGKEYLAASSKKASINGGTLDAVVQDGLVLEDGLLKWNEVKGRTVDGELLELPEDAQIIYRVVVERYITSYTSEGDEHPQYPHLGNTAEDIYDTYYTANTYFDFSEMRKKDGDSQANVRYRATVQALAMFVDGGDSDVPLVEGGHAGGTVSYAEDGAVFMGNGATKDGIVRLEEINQSIGIQDGKLTWTFTPRDASTPAESIKEKYNFIVKDDEKNVIEGDFTASLVDGTYTIIFTENPGAMKAGTYNVSVITTRGTNSDDNVVNSFAVTSLQTITKLAPIVLGDYQFEPNYDIQRETLSFEEYFKIPGNANNTITATFMVQDQPKEVIFTNTAYKFYISQTEQEDIDALDDDYYVHAQKDGQRVRDVLVIGDNASASVTFVVSRQDNFTLASDESESFVLQRSGWEAEQRINWNSDSGEFTWTFNKNSLTRAVTANKMRLRYTVSTSTTLYSDQELNEATQITLESGTEVDVQQIIQVQGRDFCAKILYEEEQYYIRFSSLNASFVQEVLDDEPVTQDLKLTDLFEIVSEQEGKTIILIGGEYFEIDSQYVQKPEFVVKATYYEKTEGGYANQPLVRIYTTSEQVFRPTIIGKVTITIRIKLNNISLESAELVGEQVEYELFDSGRGTQQNQYIIKNATQFKNISRRMNKDAFLAKFNEQASGASGFTNGTEDAKFYFKLADDVTEIDLQDIEGILFEGAFGGELDGNNKTIKYTSSKTEQPFRAEGDITIEGRDTAVKLSTNIDYLTFAQGAALFDIIGSNGTIKNLNLNVKFGKMDSDDIVKISNNALISGLAITNSGTVQNVELVGFDSKFYGDTGAGGDSRTVMAYSGLVSINSGSARISDCAVKTSISISDQSSAQLIFIGGIVYTNYATVQSCTAGEQSEGKNQHKIHVIFQKGFGAMQLSGIAVTNTGSANLDDCTNNMDIQIEVPDTNSLECYIAGVACLGKNMSNRSNHNNGQFIYDESKLTDVNKTSDGVVAVVAPKS